MVLKYHLKGLKCSACASKIETKIKELYPSATMNLTTFDLYVFDEEIDTEKVQKIINSVEKGVKLIKIDESNINNNEVETEDNDKRKIIELSLMSALFLILIFTYYSGYLTNIMAIIGFFILYLIAGRFVISKTIKNITHGNVFDENFLMTIASLGAFFIGEYPEGVAVMILYTIGEYLQEKALNNSKKSINSLVSLKVNYANLLVDGEPKKVNPDIVNVGDTILVKVGEKVPLDGVVVKGNSNIDTSAITGESFPKKVSIDDTIYSGSINLAKPLILKVTTDYSHSMISKIRDLIEIANIRKSKSEKFITTFAKYYTPFVVGLSLLIAIVPIILYEDYSWINKALILLVISCPCALVLSVPLSYFSSIGRLAKEGILVKGSNYVDELTKVDTFAYDKTGTLTYGKFEVSKFSSNGILKEQDILKLNYLSNLAEKNSNHPLALAICKYYENNIFNKNKQDNLPNDIYIKLLSKKIKVESTEEISGKGMILKFRYMNSEQTEENIFLIGNEKLLNMYNIEINDSKINNNITNVFIGLNDEYMGHYSLEDRLKEESPETISKLSSMGFKNLLLTGDTQKVAKNVAKRLNMDGYYYELLPEDKLNIIEQMSSNNKIAFIGDGVNDAPVIRRANVGISMGNLGSDVAVEASDVIIINDDIASIVKGVKISKFTKKIVYQNIILSLGIKILFITLGVLGSISLWEAVFADVGVTILAILNSLRIIRKNYND
ncbi:Cd2+/Zn2+-exporting ATPase [Methanococcus voltae]|uniref:Cd2+/Zn2+-exporting ATPase n=2 Tax=Methanococcus voltae TaxID=2188 RepID=A0A8J7S1V1_METVO|nr:heavy metal translocating P-type ATPase [Methanococcus voltae]MBP2201830.1 Cd2+/Zn2+-exporting ATPase [Methanococcus voltae]MCS3922654.1 Cd2+/Zn2+-exporting ATPase [Methanococcus voltae PS]